MNRLLPFLTDVSSSSCKHQVFVGLTLWAADEHPLQSVVGPNLDGPIGSLSQQSRRNPDRRGS